MMILLQQNRPCALALGETANLLRKLFSQIPLLTFSSLLAGLWP